MALNFKRTKNKNKSKRSKSSSKSQASKTKPDLAAKSGSIRKQRKKKPVVSEESKKEEFKRVVRRKEADQPKPEPVEEIPEVAVESQVQPEVVIPKEEPKEEAPSEIQVAPTETAIEKKEEPEKPVVQPEPPKTSAPIIRKKSIVVNQDLKQPLHSKKGFSRLGKAVIAPPPNYGQKERHHPKRILLYCPAASLQTQRKKIAGQKNKTPNKIRPIGSIKSRQGNETDPNFAH